MIKFLSIYCFYVHSLLTLTTSRLANSLQSTAPDKSVSAILNIEFTANNKWERQRGQFFRKTRHCSVDRLLIHRSSENDLWKCRSTQQHAYNQFHPQQQMCSKSTHAKHIQHDTILLRQMIHAQFLHKISKILFAQPSIEAVYTLLISTTQHNPSVCASKFATWQVSVGARWYVFSHPIQRMCQDTVNTHALPHTR